MRTAVTLVRRHNSAAFELYHGPEVPVQEQRQSVKLLMGTKEHPHFAEVAHYDRRTRHRRFLSTGSALVDFGPKAETGLPNIPPAPGKPKRARTRRST